MLKEFAQPRLRIPARWLTGIGAIAIVWFALFTSGLSGYAGSKLVFILFTVVFNALLFSGFYRQKSYSYLFLCMFLWLGFWFKFTANFWLFNYFPFGEPVGSFDSTPAAWDQAAYIAMAGGVGVMTSRWIYSLFRQKTTMLLDAGSNPPDWYSQIRQSLWVAVLVVALGVALLNVVYGIQQVGLAPRTILHWPLNAAIAWIVSIGSAIAMATLAGWDLASKKSLKMPACAVLSEALISTVSMLSRATYPFHVLPQVVALFKNRASVPSFSRTHAAVFTAVFIGLFTLSVISVSKLRDFHYTSAPVAKSAAVTPAAVGDMAKKDPVIPSVRWILIHQLLVNRWIGFEGVLAVSAYEGKSWSLLRDMLLEKREIGKSTTYQSVSKSDYQTTDPMYQFASLPGATAFFFYSGSLWATMAGMAFLALLIVCVERFLFALTANPLMTSIFGLTAANTVAQFGVTPRQDVPYFMLILLSAIIIYLIRSKTFSVAMMGVLRASSRSPH